ncbi:MAG TPA: DUF2845 domain-containing protein [Solimonas sp.]|nr:DUF2845 domain-containing protein [Solimonas sp.]
MTAVETGSFSRSVKSWQLAALMLLACAWLTPATAAGAMRCGSKLIDEGKYAVQVLAACGEPAYRDPWMVQARNGYVADSEDWYYNFGSSQLLRIVRMRNGQVTEIESDGYGFNDTASRRCGPTGIVQGESKFRLLVRCGQPVQRRAEEVLAPVYPDRPYRRGHNGYYYRQDYVTPVYREEWIYNFGSRYLLRIVTLEDGRVSDVQNGDRGFD